MDPRLMKEGLEEDGTNLTSTISRYSQPKIHRLAEVNKARANHRTGHEHSRQRNIVFRWYKCKTNLLASPHDF